MKTAELSGNALDWAVAKSEGILGIYYDEESGADLLPQIDTVYFKPSTDWTFGGPILERERIELRGDGDEGWVACDNLNSEQTGTTPLIAAMRCYVASKLGDEVELPGVLL